MNKSLQKKIYSILFFTLLSLIYPLKSDAQLLGWNAVNNGGGFGVSPWTPETIDSHLQCSGLTRGSAIGTSGNPAQSAWGGAGGWTGTASDLGSFYFTFQATAGYKINLSGISTATRRSNAGPSGCSVWYSVNNAPAVKITDWTTTASTGTTGTPNSADLTAIAALQNIGPGITVKIYIVPQGSGTGNYYLIGGTNCLKVEGAVVPLISPTITPSVTSLTSFGNVILGNTSASQSFTFDGAGLTDDVSIAAPAGFEISTDNVNWFAGSDFSPVGGSFNDMLIWVRFNPSATGAATGNITLSSPGATNKTISVSGNGLPVPELTVTPSTINTLTYPENQGPSAPFQLTSLTSTALSPVTGTIVFSIATGSLSNYEISSDGINWDFSAELPYASADNNIVNPNIYVRMKAGISEGAIPPDTVNVDGGGLSTSFVIAGIVDPASTILTDDDPYGPLCNGSDNTFDIDFTPSGSFIGTDFYAQISDADGNFSNLPENIVGSSPVSPVSVTIPAGFTAGEHYRIRIYNETPLTFSTNDNGHDIVINNITSFSSISQMETVCSGNDATINLSGLLPEAVFTITYNINSGTDQMLFGLVSDANGDLSFNVLLNEQDNNQELTITAIERTDITPACGMTITANNSVILSVNPLPTVASVTATSVCGSGEMTTVTLTGMLSGSTSDIEYTIAGGTTVIMNDIIADASGTATFEIALVPENNTQELNIVSITRTDVQPVCSNSITGINTLLEAYERPTAIISGDQSICFGTVSSDIVIDLTGTAPWNITYTDGSTVLNANNIIQSPYTFTVSNFSTKTYTITAVEDAHCQALASGMTGSATVTINTFSNGGTISGSATVCNGDNSGAITLSGYTGDIIGWQSSENISFATYTDVANTTDTLEYNNLTATTYYRAVVANGSCPADYSAVAAITVNTVPALITQPQVFCNEGHVSDLFPSGTGFQWYTDSTGGIALADSDALTTGDYYVSQTINGCESSRTQTAVTVNVTDAPVTATLVFCNQGTVADLQPSGAEYKWYTDSSGGNALADSDILTTGDYYVSQTINGCESSRTQTAVTVNVTDAPVTTSQVFCNTGTVADLEPSGTGFEWYTDSSGGNALESTDILISGDYYVSQTINGCESVRSQTSVTINITNMPEGETEQEFVEGQTISDINVTGTNLQWYLSETDLEEGTVADTNTLLVNDNTYYVTQSINDCTGEALAVHVTVVLSAETVDEDHFTLYPNPVHDVLNLEYTNPIESVAIYNIAGQELFYVTGNDTLLKVDVSQLPQGTYLIKIQSGENTKMSRIIKK